MTISNTHITSPPTEVPTTADEFIKDIQKLERHREKSTPIVDILKEEYSQMSKEMIISVMLDDNRELRDKYLEKLHNDIKSTKIRELQKLLEDYRVDDIDLMNDKDVYDNTYEIIKLRIETGVYTSDEGKRLILRMHLKLKISPNKRHILKGYFFEQIEDTRIKSSTDKNQKKKLKKQKRIKTLVAEKNERIRVRKEKRTLKKQRK